MTDIQASWLEKQAHNFAANNTTRTLEEAYKSGAKDLYYDLAFWIERESSLYAAESSIMTTLQQVLWHLSERVGEERNFEIYP